MRIKLYGFHGWTPLLRQEVEHKFIGQWLDDGCYALTLMNSLDAFYREWQKPFAVYGAQEDELMVIAITYRHNFASC